MYRYIEVFRKSGTSRFQNIDVRCFLFTHHYLAGKNLDYSLIPKVCWCWRRSEMEKALKEQNNNVACQEEESDSTVPSKRKKYGKSSVWNFFNKSADGRTAKCIKCGKTYQTSGNTTNLSCHLKNIHPNLTISELPRVQQPSVLSFMEKKYEKSSNRKQQLDSALFYYITSDLRSFTVVENKGFRNFVNLLDPRYELPSRTTLRNVSMANAYEEKKARLYAFLQDVKHCAITSDCWTSRSNECYVTVTCHFITADFELRNAVLSTEKLLDERSHSSESIANLIRTVLEEWSLLGKVTAMVTDNAKNMIKACEILQITQRCTHPPVLMSQCLQ
ncbi:E3 SUMO-protein ligase ZBED1-like [Drosophila gunungcola]|uniref:E3 SUMO-protein ligase ZBED1-like n=1 Tax=Drosophila gunungcola TaxID=103775 RepID=UPI0022E47702|nr:E3 SUMO-protein ligase ZBED1-like [Drosophila gunungcola]